MINDFDESILFSLSLIQSAIERVTIVMNIELLTLKKFLCQLVVDDVDDFNILSFLHEKKIYQKWMKNAKISKFNTDRLSFYTFFCEEKKEFLSSGDILVLKVQTSSDLPINVCLNVFASEFFHMRFLSSSAS